MTIPVLLKLILHFHMFDMKIYIDLYTNIRVYDSQTIV